MENEGEGEAGVGGAPGVGSSNGRSFNGRWGSNSARPGRARGGHWSEGPGGASPSTTKNPLDGDGDVKLQKEFESPQGSLRRIHARSNSARPSGSNSARPSRAPALPADDNVDGDGDAGKGGSDDVKGKGGDDDDEQVFSDFI